MRLVRTLVIVAVLVARVGVSDGAWMVDEHGECVERWAPADLLLGPTAIVNVPLLPFRALAGGGEYAWQNDAWWPWQVAILGPAVMGVATAAGVVEGVWWAGTGVADTVTGGYFALAPERATQLSLEPEVPRVIADAAPTPTPSADRCGRPLAAAK